MSPFTFNESFKGCFTTLRAINSIRYTFCPHFTRKFPLWSGAVTLTAANGATVMVAIPRQGRTGSGRFEGQPGFPQDPGIPHIHSNEVSREAAREQSCQGRQLPHLGPIFTGGAFALEAEAAPSRPEDSALSSRSSSHCLRI